MGNDVEKKCENGNSNGSMKDSRGESMNGSIEDGRGDGMGDNKKTIAGDHITRATAAGGTIRAFAAVTTDLVNEARVLHGMSGLAAVALGRTLTAACMMARMSKSEKDVLTIQIKGDGPLGGIVVVADADSNVRGYVHDPDVSLPLTGAGKFDVAGAIGKNGYLNVIRDMGMKEPYIGRVDLVSGEIGEDIAYYYAYSEQVPTAVALGVLVGTDGKVVSSGGYMVQLMPGADEDAAAYVEDRVLHSGTITGMLSEGMSTADILERLLGEKELEIIDRHPCRYRCGCSRERMERNLVSLGAEELEDIAEKQRGAEVKCHFCNRKYFFSEEELRTLILAIKSRQ